jgi:hypothetical protein
MVTFVEGTSLVRHYRSQAENLSQLMLMCALSCDCQLVEIPMFFFHF